MTDRAFSTGWSVVKEQSYPCGVCNVQMSIARLPQICDNCLANGLLSNRQQTTVVKGMFENPGGFGAGDCTLCGEPFNEDNPSYESKEGNAFCKGCFRDRWRVE
tara:strand:+ start:2869 stop:3180 length:312 start_codon:yes stop_codon:yes gene_type:complete